MRHALVLCTAGVLAVSWPSGAAAGQNAAGGCTASVVFRPGTGYHTFRIPAVVSVPRPGGARPVLLAFAEGRRTTGSDHGDIDVVSRRSTDGGCTWGPLRTVSAAGRDTVGNPTPAVDPKTRRVVLLTVRNAGTATETAIMRGEVPAQAGRRVFVQTSTDQGGRWSAPREITARVKRPAWRWYATGPGHALVLTTGPHKGRIVVPANHSVAPPAGGRDTGAEPRYYRGHSLLSDDGGRNWRIGYLDKPTDGGVNVNESTAAQLPDGRVYVNSRNQQGTASGHRAHAYSSDGGRTLKAPFTVTKGLTTPMVQGSLLPVRFNQRNLLLFSAPAHAHDRRQMTLRTSRNNGATWRNALTLSPRPAAYSDLVQINKNLVGLLYETGATTPYETITFRRLHLHRIATS